MSALVIFVCAFIGFYIVATIFELINIPLMKKVFDFLQPVFDFLQPIFDFMEKVFNVLQITASAWRIIGRVALLLVVMGFFMPVGLNRNGFQIAEYATKVDKTIGAMVGSTSGVGVWLYISFFISLLGGLLIIPLVMKKKTPIGIDWVSVIIPIVCFIVLSSKLTDITDGKISDLRLEIGGYVIIIGLIVSLLAIIFASGVPEKEKTAF